MKQIFQDYISTRFTPVNTLKNILVDPKDKHQKAIKVILCTKFAATQTLLVKRCILVRHPNHYNVLNNTVDLVTMKMIQQSLNTILSGHQIGINDVTI